MSSRRVRLRAAANWGNGSTLLGLTLARLGGGTVVRDVDGLWHAAGVRGPHGRRVFTVGNVVLHRHSADHLHRRPGLLAHEAAHATQWAWTGAAFVPLYLAECVISWAVTGNAATGNAFEIGAGLERGGYPTPGLRRRARRQAR